MQVAVGVNRNGLVIDEGELDDGFFAGLEGLALAALFRLEIDPLDIMLGDHGMMDRTYGYGHGVTVYGGDGHVLFATGFHGVGGKGFHLLTTADHGDACIVDHADQVAAVTADIELRIAHYNDLRNF